MDVESCDRLIKKYDSRLRPELIEPIREWRHHKGKRGDLKILLLEILKQRAPAALTLIEICCEIEMRWKLIFLTEPDHKSWRRDAVGRALRTLAAERKIVALHTMKGGDPTSEVGRWREI
jgi:hypothetical protein